MDSEIRISALNFTEVRSLLENAKEDFPAYSDSFIEDYARKLSTYADFVTWKNEKGDISAIIAFYSNRKPTAYISHIWVAKCQRGGVFVA
ncbi:MAG: hypothetical protein NC453_13985 [Muribaculum sp.]|nr:hypothetical protein [Muribaculum sp.]